MVVVHGGCSWWLFMVVVHGGCSWWLFSGCSEVVHSDCSGIYYKLTRQGVAVY